MLLCNDDDHGCHMHNTSTDGQSSLVPFDWSIAGWLGSFCQRSCSNRCCKFTHIYVYTHTYQCNQFSEHTTAGTIEAWNYILKRIDHKEKHMRPDVCIQKHYPVIVGRRRQYCDDLKL